jgi:hypothetical protein
LSPFTATNIKQSMSVRESRFAGSATEGWREQHRKLVSPWGQQRSSHMRKVLLGIAGVVVCLGLGLAVVGCGSSSPDKGKMGGDKMGTEKMGNEKMGTEKMGTEKMGGEKMSGETKDKM